VIGQQENDLKFSSAVRKHLDGDFSTAETLYREIIRDYPAQARAKHCLGFLLQQTDRLDEAFDQLTGAIALEDQHAEWHFNLGIVLARQDNAGAAIAAFLLAIEIDPDKYFYWTNLGAAYESNQESERAEHCYRAAANIDPNCADAFYLLAALCLKLERYDEARHFNYCGIAVAPAGYKSMTALGQAYYELGRVGDAIALFEKWLLVEPDNPVALHLLAAYRGQQVPEQCSSRYIEQTFDTFANNFENVLGRLKYCGPQLVADFLAGHDVPASSLNVLDLGCGTGMVGEVVTPYASEITGVDLSQSMLDKSAAKQVYRHLHKSDIAHFLQTSQKQYDLITCMDTFIYIGRLDEVLAQIRRNLNPDGMLLFSTEKLAGARVQDYQLNVSGRYSHHPDYLSEKLKESGFKIQSIRDVVIRMESGCPIEGQFAFASRMA
jgi:predicted TPR repeat methyltransferase